jgi:pimeloyl-ACP methyl ester carboxylesterase
LNKPRRWRILTVVGLLVAASSIIGLLIIDRALAGSEPVAFTDPAGEELVGTYIPGTQPAGVLLLEGFGSDQVALRSIATTFAREGFHVFTFDFSGHGRSPGSLAFDNAATDRLARQALAAQTTFTRLSGLSPDRIILLGHSMGARVALQAATLADEPVAGLVLLGAQVNLATNIQSEVFTGISDTDLEWVQALGPNNPPVDILLLIGSWDDVLTPTNARLLLQKLVGAEALEGQVWGTEGATRELVILPSLLHNYEVYSPGALSHARAWVAAEREVTTGDDPTAAWRILLWFGGLAGLFLTVLSGGRWAAAALKPIPTTTPTIAVTNVKRFLWAKLLLWLAALPLIGLLFGIFFFIPLGTPVFNLTYVGFLGAYGLLMLLLYALGRVPGTEGRLPFGRRPAQGYPSLRRTLLAIGASAALQALVTALAQTGWFAAPPLGDRLVWLVLFTPVTALGFWIGHHEQVMLDGRVSKAAATLIGLLPFFLWTLLQAAIGSLSGMVGGVQGLFILGLVLLQGTLVQRLAGRPWLTAVLQAITLYWLVLPSGVLFE